MDSEFVRQIRADARKKALREAADEAVSMADNEADGYYGQACHEVASALRALAEGAPDGQQ